MSRRIFLLALLSYFFILCPLGFTDATLQEAEAYFNALSNDEKTQYVSWLTENFSSYTHHTFLSSAADDGLGSAVFWKIDENEGIIDFGVAARSNGWLGFGLSEAGGMLGADVVLFQASTNELQDSYILEDRYVLTDDCQDWHLLSSSTNDGWIIVGELFVLIFRKGKIASSNFSFLNYRDESKIGHWRPTRYPDYQ